ncbi:hypothetical protein [Hydrogenimonas sp. SS33]|uniref:hypothetical protein n=1 Tax=Hydrogenimonas leucolamina TaxID=2954236 RepID=UPI00336C1A64
MKKSALLLLLALLPLFQGCVSTSTHPQIVVHEESNATTQKVPTWFSKALREDERYFYGAGEGKSIDDANRSAAAALKQQIAESVGRHCEKKRSGCAWLTKRQRQEMVKRVAALGPVTKVLKKEKSESGRWYLLVGAERKTLAGPLRKRVLQRLVPIEERWHSVSKASPLQRYQAARRSEEDLKVLLPDFILADAILPYGKTMRMRVLRAIPYFQSIQKNVLKELVFCVEHPRIPAYTLFSRALGRALHTKGYRTVPPSQRRSGTVCVDVSARLVHREKGSLHTLTADITLKFHRPYQDPFLTKRYRVEGESGESGPMALEAAAEKFRRRLEKEGFF